MRSCQVLLSACCAAALLCLAACSGKGYESAAPAPDAGFIEHPERQHNPENLPFQKVWLNPDYDRSQYQSIIIAPVNTDHMLEMSWWKRVNPRHKAGLFKKDVDQLARYMQERVREAFIEDRQQRYWVVDDVVGPTLCLEMALIEVVPSKAGLHALGWLPLVPGLGTAASLANERSAAFEARLRDAETGEVLVTFADRERQKAGPIDMRRLTWYGPARKIIDNWAGQMVQVANRQPGEEVSDDIPVTLRPW